MLTVQSTHVQGRGHGLELALVYVDDVIVTVEVAVAASLMTVELRAAVADPISIVEHRVSLVQVLYDYFSRLEEGSLVPTGTAGTITEASLSEIRHFLVDDPPSAPGMQIGLLSVRAYPASSERSYIGPKIRIQRLAVGEADIEYRRVLRLGVASEKPAPAEIDISRLELAPGVVFGSVYVSGKSGEDVRNAILDIAREIYGQEALFVLQDPVQGSWWQRFKIFTSKVVNHAEVREKAAEANRRLSIELLDRASAEVDSIKADSLAKLVVALKDHDEAAIVMGQLIIVKFDGKIFSRNVTALMARELEQRPSLLVNPKALLAKLDNVQAAAEMDQAQRQLETGRQLKAIESPDA